MSDVREMPLAHRSDREGPWRVGLVGVGYVSDYILRALE